MQEIRKDTFKMFVISGAEQTFWNHNIAKQEL